ncbi:MAG: hypothetical protein L6Q77_14340 [Bacteroidetes bacterium]|nr:hypothetical protein [Bacteroidota bacterium]
MNAIKPHKPTLFLVGHSEKETRDLVKKLDSEFALINLGVSGTEIGFLGDYAGWVDVALMDYSFEKSIIKSLITEILISNSKAKIGLFISKEDLQDARNQGLIHPRITLLVKPVHVSQILATFTLSTAH